MSLPIYKPNGKNQGAALNINISNQKGREPMLFINMIRQFNWNAEARRGSFAGNKDQPEHTVNMKIGHAECGDIISAITNRYNFCAFHTFNDNSTTLNLSPWDQVSNVTKYNPKTKQQEVSDDILPSFGLSLKKGSFNPIKIPLSPGECQLILHYLKRFLTVYFDYIDSPVSVDSFREISKQDVSTPKNDDLFLKAEPIDSNESKPEPEVKDSPPQQLDGEGEKVDDESAYY